MSIRQGEGNGFIFGPDVQNTGSDALDVAASTANNLSVAFEDGDLVITHAEAGAMSLTSFTSTNASTAVFNVADSADAAQRDPIVLQDTAASNEITVRGSAAASGLTLNFSNTYGWAVSGDIALSGAMTAAIANAGTVAAGNITASIAAFTAFEATYSFKITDGSGNVYADLSGASELDLQRYQNTDAAIKLAVETALSAGIAANFANDNQIAMSDFTVAYDNGQLSITSASGRRLAVEQFSSKFGYADAVGANGGATEKLSSQARQATEIRLQRGTGGVTAPATAALEFWIEGLSAGASLITVDLSTMVDGTTGTDHPLEQANIFEAQLQTVSGDLKVSYDYDTDEFVIHNPTGAQLDLRRVTISAGFEDALIKDLSTFSYEGEATTVAIKSSVEQGAVRDATSLKMTFSQDALDGVSFKLNNNSISASDFNFATDDFASSTFKSNIESVLDTLNSDYPSDVIGYSMDLATRTLTFTHADGAALKLTDFAATSDTMVAEVTDVVAGTSTTFDNVEVKQEASATGDRDPAAAVEVAVEGSESASSSSSSSLAQVTVATSEGALAALDSIDAALSFILEQRGMVGALENRLSHTISNLSNVVLNTEAAKGRIVDADFAAETGNLTKNQILQQAATSMLAQANQAKQGILALLQ
jgi:flagellin